jgi:LmbE family N-acetylglucosaminyl deacetylase
LEIFYTDANLRRLAAIIREVKPLVLLTHSPSDYMEDHMITCRLAVTAAFAKGMPNYNTIPETAPQETDCTIYHALPHTLKDQLCNPVIANSFVNTSSVFDQKVKALSAHESQQSWLDVSQKMSSYIQQMEHISLAVGKMSGAFKHAEGWRKHLHFGYCSENADPLTELGEDYRINKE